MEHRLIAEEISTADLKYEFYVLEIDSNIVNLGIQKTDFCNDSLSNILSINITKKELHSLIGTLLHVQQKMKGSV